MEIGQGVDLKMKWDMGGNQGGECRLSDLQGAETESVVGSEWQS